MDIIYYLCFLQLAPCFLASFVVDFNSALCIDSSCSWAKALPFVGLDGSGYYHVWLLRGLAFHSLMIFVLGITVVSHLVSLSYRARYASSNAYQTELWHLTVSSTFLPLHRYFFVDNLAAEHFSFHQTQLRTLSSLIGAGDAFCSLWILSVLKPSC